MLVQLMPSLQLHLLGVETPRSVPSRACTDGVWLQWLDDALGDARAYAFSCGASKAAIWVLRPGPPLSPACPQTVGVLAKEFVPRDVK